MARIIEVGLFLFESDGSSAPLVDTLINPGVPIPEKVAGLAAIRAADLAARGWESCEIPATTRSPIADLDGGGVPIVVCHATCDGPLLENELTRHGHAALPAVPRRSSSTPGP